MKGEELNQESQDIKQAVREHYASAVKAQGKGCCVSCESVEERGKGQFAALAGYSPEELASLPQSVVENSFGCGNPLAFVQVMPGQTVLDLGSGAGIDCLLAASRVGPAGRVIGVDMTPEMIEQARDNAQAAGLSNVEFRLGEMDHLPVADNSVDWIISNCVINLAPDKARVFSEAQRVLKPGGKLLVSDIITKDLPPKLCQDIGLLVDCVAGALEEDEYLGVIKQAGFEQVKIVAKQEYDEATISAFLPDASEVVERVKPYFNSTEELAQGLVGKIYSAKISAQKLGCGCTSC